MQVNNFADVIHHIIDHMTWDNEGDYRSAHSLVDIQFTAPAVIPAPSPVVEAAPAAPVVEAAPAVATDTTSAATAPTV